MKNSKDNSGQAIFEFLVFVPLLLGLYGIIVNITGSINASINQQKSTRGYFYNILKGNSMFPSNIDLNGLSSIGTVNFFTIGYRERSASGGVTSFAPCYKLQSLLSEGNSETCDNPDFQDAESQFIRVYTAYGVCGPTLSISENGYIHNLGSAGSAGCSNL